ncbi:hypothetical protein BD408DRAFT_417624 [Parasitella parasitica]|nr:hypothetical protein BD408DRAFT_417624 [Parasitella parasitica]
MLLLLLLLFVPITLFKRSIDSPLYMVFLVQGCTQNKSSTVLVTSISNAIKQIALKHIATGVCLLQVIRFPVALISQRLPFIS